MKTLFFLSISQQLWIVATFRLSDIDSKFDEIPPGCSASTLFETTPLHSKQQTLPASVRLRIGHW